MRRPDGGEVGASGTGGAQPPVLWLPATIAAAMREEGSRRLPNETGGVLVGYRWGADIVVVAATGPGPRAEHEPTRFRRDGVFTQAEVDRLHEASQGRDDYVAEWHTHPVPCGPSARDRASLEWISANPRYQRATPLMVLCRRTRWRRWRLEAYQWVASGLVLLRIRADLP